MANRLSPLQMSLFCLIAGGIIVASVLGTLYMAGFRLSDLPFTPDASGPRYHNVTMTDAQLECLDHSRETFGRRLRDLEVDDLSSRVNFDEGVYKIYLQAQIYQTPERQGRTEKRYINCFVKTRQLAIERFQHAADSSEQPEREEDGGGLFGL